MYRVNTVKGDGNSQAVIYNIQVTGSMQEVQSHINDHITPFLKNRMCLIT